MTLEQYFHNVPKPNSSPGLPSFSNAFRLLLHTSHHRPIVRTSVLSVSGDEFWIWGCFMLPLCWCKGCHKAEGDKACGSPTRKHLKNRWKKSHTTVTYQLLLKSLQMILIINFYAVPYWTMSYLILAAIQTGRFLFRVIPLVMTFAKNRQKPQRKVFISF